MKRTMRSLLCGLLCAVLLLGLCPAVHAGTPWYDSHPSWVASHSDWHFDITREPDRPMTVEEFVALTTAYCWWSTGDTSGTYPLPKDKNGDYPADWAAPYIRYYAGVNAFDPKRVDYDAPATLGFMMQFYSRLRGKFSYDAVNLYSFTGTEGYTASELLQLCVAVDYGVVPYTPGMDVSQANLLRRDLETKYKIPDSLPAPIREPVQQAKNYPTSMAFFEESNPAEELARIKANGAAINSVMFAVERMLLDGSSGHFLTDDGMARRSEHLELLQYCKDTGKKTYLGVYNFYDETAFRTLKNDPSRIAAAADEMVGYVDAHDMDGLSMIIEFDGQEYRETFNALLRACAERLHSRDKELIIFVGAYFSEKEADEGFYDYDVIDAAADQIILILYDEHSYRSYNGGWSEAGFLSHLGGMRRRITYASARFGPERVLMTIADYGTDYNLTTHHAEAIDRAAVLELQQQHHATVKSHDDYIDDTYFEYTAADNSSHVVYYDSEEALMRRLDYATQYGIGGVCVYHAGADLPQVYEKIGKELVELPFRDISRTAYYYNAVDWAVSNGVTSGLSAVSFGPDGSCTRGQVVTFLWRAKGSPEHTSLLEGGAERSEAEGVNSFEDVKEGAFYYKAVLWAVENGITNGLDATHFGPNETCNRGQVVTFLWRTNEKPEPKSENCPFTDVTPGAFYYKAMLWAVENGVTNGISATSFGPANTCTRGQVVTFLFRAVA